MKNSKLVLSKELGVLRSVVHQSKSIRCLLDSIPPPFVFKFFRYSYALSAGLRTLLMDSVEIECYEKDKYEV